jgi:hypothetical protein
MNLDEAAYYTVGRIIRWWALVENSIDSSIRDLLSRPDTTKIDTSLIMSFKQRRQLLKDLLSEIVVDKNVLLGVFHLLDQIGSVQLYRDLVAHGLMINDSRRPDTHYYLSRTRWSSPPVVRRSYIRKEKLVEIENKIVKLHMKLFMATAGCHQLGWLPYLDTD